MAATTPGMHSVSFSDAFLPLSGNPPHVVCAGRGFVVAYQEPSSHVKASVIMQAAVNAIATGGQALVVSLALSASSAPVRTLTPLSSLDSRIFQRLEFAYVESIVQCCELLASTGTAADTSGGVLPDVILVDLEGMVGRHDHYAVGKLLTILDHTVSYLRHAQVAAARGAVEDTTPGVGVKSLPYFLVALDDSVSLPKHHMQGPQAKLRSFPLACTQNPLIELRIGASRDTVLLTLTELTRAPTPLAVLQYTADSVSVRLLAHS